MLRVEMLNYEQLTDEEKNGPDISHNGGGAEYATYMRVSQNGHRVALYSDAMEPEDARFSRDLSWVADAIERAYSVGLDDGRNGE